VIRCLLALLAALLNSRQPVLEGVHVAWKSALAFQPCHFVLSHVVRFISRIYLVMAE
jgi:hypothetical protein